MECVTCQFYEPFIEPRTLEVPGLGAITVDGECRRNPPSVFKEKTPHRSTFFPVFPPVSKSHWCGAGMSNDVGPERSFDAWDRVDKSVLEGMADKHKDW